jgi:thiol-disulfide isomerase/thioredoxin
MYRLAVSFIFLSLLSFTGTSFASYGDEVFFSSDAGSVDLKISVSFEEYKRSGEEKYVSDIEERMRSCGVSEKFIDGAKKIDRQLVLLMIGMTYCPDCKAAYPFMEAISRVNPNVTTRYIPRNGTPGAREFIVARAGRPNMPAVFVLLPDGKVLDGAYIETPSKVTDLLMNVSSDEERDSIWKDFHNGVYDEEIENDLLNLLETALGSL